jgi:hypothetical protein
MTKPGPGKFQANDSLEASKILYEHSLDGSHDSCGDSSYGPGWYCLVIGDALTAQEKTVCDAAAYICEETPEGFFVYYAFESGVEALLKFEEIQKECAEFEAEVF